MYLLNRRFPGIIKSGKSLLKAVLPSGAAAIVVYLVLQLNHVQQMGIFSQAALSSGLMLFGLAVSVPFVWKDIRQLLHLGSQPD
jgi:hypothetical protein